jgi:hypothetical protein
MNTPDLLGGFYPNEQEYFCMKSKDFEWLTDEFIPGKICLLPASTSAESRHKF